MGTCAGYVLWAGNTTWAGNGQAHNVVEFKVSNWPGVCYGGGYCGFAFYFPAGAFSQLGTYTNDLLIGYSDATMVVSTVPTPVPEPANRALITSGLAALALRSRQQRKPP